MSVKQGRSGRAVAIREVTWLRMPRGDVKTER
jgi:hypothetical protein